MTCGRCRARRDALRLIGAAWLLALACGAAAESRLLTLVNGGAATKGDDAAASSAVLVVTVTGTGKPIAHAEVKVKFPAGSGETMTPTNEDGQARFTSPQVGTADVRVIAAGWESALRPVELAEGEQQMTIELTALPAPK